MGQVAFSGEGVRTDYLLEGLGLVEGIGGIQPSQTSYSGTPTDERTTCYKGHVRGWIGGFLRKPFAHLGWAIGGTSGNETRWIHPGSGSPQKNAPFALFERRAREWLDRTPNSSVVFSFGEADESVLSLARASDLSAHSRVRLKTFETLGSFTNALVESASNFVGNDSGPCHLASMLGIPTDVFRSTNPMVWKPLGPRVRVYLDDSGANRIL